MSKPIFRIKEIAKEKGISIKTMASRIGIGLSALSQSIDGNPTAERLQEIAIALGVDITELFEKRGDFVAFIRRHGVTHTFSTESDLKEFVDTLGGEE